MGLGRLWRMYIVQNCFGLSDEGIEDALYDSQAIRRFVGIDLGREDAPDATRLLRFRQWLEARPLTVTIFNAINAHLAERGLFLRQGTVIDAPPDCGTALDQESHRRAGPGNAPEQEEQSMALWHEGSYGCGCP